MIVSMSQPDYGLRLEPGILNVVTLRLVLDREHKPETITVVCHTYYQGSGDVELWNVEDGRLVRRATYYRVLSCERVDD